MFGDKDIKIKKASVLGKNKNVLKFILENQQNKNIEAMFFGDLEHFEQSVEDCYGRAELDNLYRGIDNKVKMDLLYYPSINEFRGNVNLQITIQSFRMCR